MQERAGCAPHLFLGKPGNTHPPNKESYHHHCHHKPTELGWRMHQIPVERRTPNRDITQGCGNPPAAYSAASGHPRGTEGRGRRKPPCNQHKPVCCCALGSDVPPHLPLSFTLPGTTLGNVKTCISWGLRQRQARTGCWDQSSSLKEKATARQSFPSEPVSHVECVQDAAHKRAHSPARSRGT